MESVLFLALLRTRATVAERRTQNIRLTLSNLGAVLICFGIPTQVWAVTLAGVALLVTAVLWHAVSIFLRSRKSLAGRFGRTVHYYIASAALLTVGAVLGAIIARGDASNLVLAHAVLNVFGWIGVTVAGTLVTLWPTILRTKADDHATTGAVRALPALVAGVLTAAAGFVFELMSVVALGLAAYLAGLLLISVSLWRAARRAAPESFAALSVGAAFVWWIGITAVLLVAAVTAAITGSGHESLSDLFRQAVPYLVAGFAAQVLIGALSYLIPVVLGGGPTPVRVGTIAFDRLGMLRVCVANLALGVCALPVSSVMRVVGVAAVFHRCGIIPCGDVAGHACATSSTTDSRRPASTDRFGETWAAFRASHGWIHHCDAGGCRDRSGRPCGSRLGELSTGCGRCTGADCGG